MHSSNHASKTLAVFALAFAFVLVAALPAAGAQIAPSVAGLAAPAAVARSSGADPSTATIVEGTVLSAVAQVGSSGEIVTDLTLAGGPIGSALGTYVMRMEGGQSGGIGMWTEMYAPVRVGDVIAAPVRVVGTSSIVAARPVVEGALSPAVPGAAGVSSNVQAAGTGYSYSGVHWDVADLPVRFYIDSSVPADRVNAIRAAAQTWVDDPGSDFVFQYAGTTSAAAGNQDGKNVVAWNMNDSSSTLAVNRTWYYTSNLQIIEFDIQFNTHYTWATDGSASSYDVQSVGTHELGHSLQLEDLYGASDSEETMYGYSSPGSTKQRTLEAGDRAGIDIIYPSATPPDTTPPATLSDAAASYDGPATIHLTASDPGGSGVAVTYSQLDGGTTTVQNPVVVRAPGTHTLRYWSVDAAGNSETPQQVSFVVRDPDPPVTRSDAASWYGDVATILLTATDAQSGVAATHWQLGSGPVMTGTTVSVAAPGTYTLRYWSVDVSGNSETPHEVTFTVADTTSPTTWSDAQTSYEGTATIRLTATDRQSGISATYWRLDGGTISTGASVVVNTPGRHVLEFWSVDGAGNTEPANRAVFTLGGPVVPVVSDDAIASYADSATIRLDASEPLGGGGIASIGYRLDGGPTVVVPGASCSVVVTLAGPHALAFFATDVDGVSSAPTVTAFLVTGAAVISASGPAGPITYGQTVTIWGRLEAVAGASASQMRIQTQRYTPAGWVAEPTMDATTGADGAFAVVVRPSSNTDYRFVFQGTDVLRGCVGAQVQVPVRAKVTLSAPLKARRSVAFTVSGAVAPAHSGKVRLDCYRLVSGHWKLSSSPSASVSSRGSYSARLKLAAGKWRLRASHQDSGHASGASIYRFVTVK